MSTIEVLKGAKTLKDLAHVLHFKPKNLAYILYQIPEEKKYNEFAIPKKNGGFRNICSPSSGLRLLQRRLSEVLSACFFDLLDNKRFSSLSHAFIKGKSIQTHAKKHTKKRFVFNVDLKDFFPSFNFGRVRGFFIKSRDFQLAPKIATIVAQIACYKNSLPQGSPCSPVISNLISNILDFRLVRLAKKAKCTYSRYADDLSFSTNQKTFPKMIAEQPAAGGSSWIPGSDLVKTIESCGFRINLGKLSMQYKTGRQLVTGLVVNSKVNVRRDYFRSVRVLCNKLFKTGAFSLMPTPKLGEPEVSLAAKMNILEGILSFIYWVKLPNEDGTYKKKRNSPTSAQRLYRRFLFFKNFYYNSSPTILCEGVTDFIYIKSALEALFLKFPRLISKEGSKWKAAIKFLKFKKGFKDVMAVAEGTSGLLEIVKSYKDDVKHYKIPGMKNPVIIIADHDKGSDRLKGFVSEYDFSKPFFNVTDNLYLIFTPKIDPEVNVAIEDLFPASILNERIDGKVFSRKDEIDTGKEYGKVVFANKVVKPNKSKIDFSGFVPLIQRIESVIAHHQGKGKNEVKL